MKNCELLLTTVDLFSYVINILYNFLVQLYGDIF